MYIEDNAADKKEKVGEEGKINPFMNIVDWEKLVKYFINDKSVRGTMTEEGTNFRMKNTSPPSAHSLRPVCIL